jgi:hypothetical protein
VANSWVSSRLAPTEKGTGDPVTIPTQPEPADATRFATRPKQRRKELVNATDNEQAKLRKKTVTEALAWLGAPDFIAPPVRVAAHGQMVAGMWRQYAADDRTLDPETVAEQFARAEREYSVAIHNRAVIRQYGVTA